MTLKGLVIQTNKQKPNIKSTTQIQQTNKQTNKHSQFQCCAIMQRHIWNIINKEYVIQQT